MTITKNLPLLLNLSYYGFNRGLNGGDLSPVFDGDGNVKTTFCNLFIQYILNGFGYGAMNNMMANQMFDFMFDMKNGWISVSDDVAQNHANQGVIVIAAHKNDGAHGHVCLILPGILEKSHSYGKAVPKAVSIGKDVFYGKKVSFAFRAEEMPTYFALSSMI